MVKEGLLACGFLLSISRVEIPSFSRCRTYTGSWITTTGVLLLIIIIMIIVIIIIIKVNINPDHRSHNPQYLDGVDHLVVPTSQPSHQLLILLVLAQKPLNLIWIYSIICHADHIQTCIACIACIVLYLIQLAWPSLIVYIFWFCMDIKQFSCNISLNTFRWTLSLFSNCKYVLFPCFERKSENIQSLNLRILYVFPDKSFLQLFVCPRNAVLSTYLLFSSQVWQ